MIKDDEAYLNDVITANITIPSLERFKENIQDLDPELFEIELVTLTDVTTDRRKKRNRDRIHSRGITRISPKGKRI